MQVLALNLKFLVADTRVTKPGLPIKTFDMEIRIRVVGPVRWWRLASEVVKSSKAESSGFRVYGV